MRQMKTEITVLSCMHLGSLSAFKCLFSPVCPTKKQTTPQMSWPRLQMSESEPIILELRSVLITLKFAPIILKLCQHNWSKPIIDVAIMPKVLLTNCSNLANSHRNTSIILSEDVVLISITSGYLECISTTIRNIFCLKGPAKSM